MCFLNDVTSAGGTYLKSKTYHTWGVMTFILLGLSVSYRCVFEFKLFSDGF